MNNSKNHLLDPSKTEGVCLTLFFCMVLNLDLQTTKPLERLILIQHKKTKPGVTV